MKPKINQLVLWDNRFGIVVLLADHYCMCKGITGENFLIDYREFDRDNAFMDIQTASLYDFQDALGENVYDSFCYVTNCRVIETAQATTQSGESVYYVTLHDFEKNEVVLRVIRRFKDGMLRWTKP